MDETLRRSLREAVLDPAAREMAAVSLARAGELPRAVQLVRAALAEGSRLPGALDHLRPDALGSWSARVLDRRAGDHLNELVWWPDERGLHVVEGYWRGSRILSWDLGEEPQPLLELDAVPLPPRVTDLYSFGGLALDPAGERLALSIRCFDTETYQQGDAYLWCVLDLAGGALRQGPLVVGPPTRTWFDGHLLGSAEGSVVAWKVNGKGDPRVVLRGADTSVAEGSCLGRTTSELVFDSPLRSDPPTRRPSPPGLSAHPILSAAWGGRAVICDRAAGRLLLCDAHGELAQVPLPDAPGKLVEVCPCPSGWVVALRHQQQPRITLVDLADASSTSVELEHLPRRLAWSPSARALAVTSRNGVLQLLEGERGGG